MPSNASKSTELRWFFTDTITSVETWFKQHGKKFNGVWGRSDIYAHVDNHDSVSLKVREGKLELKTLIDNKPNFMVTPQCEGLIQHWEKWSFTLKENVEVQDVFKNKEDLIVLKKERLLLTYFTNDNILSLTNKPSDDGCQVEYTRLEIKNKIMFSLGFEAFGEPEQQLQYLKSTAFTFCSAIKNLTLSVDASYGYPSLLAQLSH